MPSCHCAAVKQGNGWLPITFPAPGGAAGKSNFDSSFVCIDDGGRVIIGYPAQGIYKRNPGAVGLTGMKHCLGFDASKESLLQLGRLLPGIPFRAATCGDDGEYPGSNIPVVPVGEGRLPMGGIEVLAHIMMKLRTMMKYKPTDTVHMVLSFPQVGLSVHHVWGWGGVL